MDLELAGLSAIVTGGGKGIGGAIVSSLASEGVRVLAVDRDADALQHQARHELVEALALDLAAPGCGERIVEHAAEHFGGVDLLVNNVGAAPVRSGFADVSDDDWSANVNLNLMSVVRVTRAAIPYLVRSPGHASVVNVASTSGRYPEPMLVDYAASKAAVLSVTGALATELGPHGVRVNAVSPGPTRTPLWDKPGGFADQMAARYGLPRDEAVAHHISNVRLMPLGKAGTADEVADAVTFLLSQRASHISGTVLAVHGGMATHLL